MKNKSWYDSDFGAMVGFAVMMAAMALLAFALSFIE